MDYLRWSKVHPRKRFELVHSGIGDAALSDFVTGAAPLPELEVRGSYGDPEVIDLIARRYGHPSEGVVPVPGASCGNFVAIAACARRGEAILIEHPVYEPITRVIEFLELNPRYIARRPESEFGVSIEAIGKELDRGARAVVLTNLHNPSGAMVPLGDMKAIALLCQEHGAALVVDEVYLDGAGITGNGALWTAAGFGDHVLVINSLTKIYGLSGLRGGWVLAGARQAERCREIMDLLSVNNAAPAAGLTRLALNNIRLLEDRYRSVHARGRGAFQRWMAEERRLGTLPNHGALFELLRLTEGVTGNRLGEILATRYETQVVAGEFFDLPNHIRVGLDLEPELLAEAFSRISTALDELGIENVSTTSGFASRKS